MTWTAPSPTFVAHLARLAATPLALWTGGCIFTTSCVAAGTRVATPFGWVLVEAMCPGDAILAVDVATGTLVPAEVRALRRSRRECLALVTDSGSELIVTPDHPVFAPRLAGFVDAGRLALGQEGHVFVVDAPDVGARVHETRLGACRTYAGVHEVFDLTVSGTHPTFVAEGLVVHNKSPDPTETGATSSSDSGGESEGTGSTAPTTGTVPTTDATTGSTGTTGSSTGTTGSTGTATGGAATFPCGDMLQCEVGGEYCQIVHAGIPDTPDSFSCQVMPVDCILEPTCACLETQVPGGICMPTPEGGFTVELFAP